jgi:hypothetical protein
VQQSRNPLSQKRRLRADHLQALVLSGLQWTPKGPDGPFFCVRPAWAHTCGCKSRCELVTVSKVKRNCVRATERGKEAWSVNREPMNKNRIEGVAKQGERARNREALVTKARWRRCGGCAMKVCDPYLGRSRLVSERKTALPEREVSRGRSSGSTRPTRPDGDREGPNESESLRTCKAARPCVRCWGDLGGWA